MAPTQGFITSLSLQAGVWIWSGSSQWRSAAIEVWSISASVFTIQYSVEFLVTIHSNQIKLFYNDILQFVTLYCDAAVTFDSTSMKININPTSDYHWPLGKPFGYDTNTSAETDKKNILAEWSKPFIFWSLSTSV